jgi:hypothetical protein
MLEKAIIKYQNLTIEASAVICRLGSLNPKKVDWLQQMS